VTHAALAVLAVGACGLTATLAWELGAFASADARIAARPRAAIAAAPAEVMADHTGEWISAILARPVFSPDRRPVAEIASTPGVRSPQGLPRLSGVLVGPFGRSAIFEVDGRRPLVVDEGGRIDTWTVGTIEADAVQISGLGGTRTVRPSFASSASAITTGTPGVATPRQHVGPSSPQ